MKYIYYNTHKKELTFENIFYSIIGLIFLNILFILLYNILEWMINILD